MIRLLVLTTLLFVHLITSAQDNFIEINNWLNDISLKSASIGITLMDESGTVLYENNSNTSLIPASNLKLITTAAALDKFGPNHRFETKISHSGVLENGVLRGDLYLIGGGDPTFGSKLYGGYESLFAKLVGEIKTKHNLTNIEGAVIGDDAFFGSYQIPRTWIWEDMGNYYGAGPCGLTMYDNTYYLTFQTPQEVGASSRITKMDPVIPGLKHDNAVKSAANNRDNAYIFGSPYNFNRKVEGTLPAGRTAFVVKGSMPDPPAFAAQSFNNELINQGVAITEKPTTIRSRRINGKVNDKPVQLIYTHKGQTVAEIIKVTNQKSNNLFAEHLFLHTAKNRGQESSFGSASNNLKNWLKVKEISTDGLFLVDGSGMSRFNGITTTTIAQLLLYMNKSAHAQVYLNSLSTSGKNGTLRSFLRNSTLEGRVVGKSGYMERVRSYSGYLIKGDKKYIFSIIVNNYSCSAGAMKKKLENLMLTIDQNL